MKTSLLLLALAGFGVLSAQAYEWKNVSKENRIGGRMVSAGYLKGNIVLVDCRDYGDKANEDAIKQLQEVWGGFKSKPFVLLGSHRGTSTDDAVAEQLTRLGVTYPVYRDAGLVDGEPKNESGRPLVFMLDPTGRKKLFVGRDVRQVQSPVGSAIVSESAPMTSKQWRFLLDWEIENLPGRALNRMREFRKRFPSEACDYDAAWDKLSGNEEIVQLAKLVDFARKVKDRDTSSTGAKRLSKELIDKAVEKYSPLKASSNPAVSQEAKNSLADLKFVAATL